MAGVEGGHAAPLPVLGPALVFVALAEMVGDRDGFHAQGSLVWGVFFFHILSGYRHMGASRLIRTVGPSGWVAGCDKCPVQAEKREGQEMSHYAFIRRKTKIPLHNILLTAILCCALSEDKAVK